MGLYEADFYAWTQQTADQLRRGEFSALDMAELVEEVIDMGNRHRDQLESRLTILIAHMLKWDYQPDKRSNSWRATIKLQRNRIQRLLKRMPSLGSALQEVLLEAYEDATALASEETTFPESRFPASLPYTMLEILSKES